MTISEQQLAELMQWAGEQAPELRNCSPNHWTPCGNPIYDRYGVLVYGCCRPKGHAGNHESLDDRYKKRYMRCRVRLEIAAEERRLSIDEIPGWAMNEGCCEGVEQCVVARVYLAEPRCQITYYHYPEACECGPLAERRVG